MHIVDDLGKPLLIKHARQQLRLNLRQHEPIAVVIVSRVFLIQPRQVRAFIRRANRPLIPLHNDVQPIRICRGNEQHDDVFENRLHFRCIGRCELIGELHRHLR